MEVSSSQQKDSVHRVVFGILILLLLGAILLAYRALIGPLLIASLLAYVLSPGVDLITRKTRVGRKWAARSVFSLTLVVVGIILVFLVPEAVREARTLSATLASVRDRLVLAGAELEGSLGIHIPLEEAWVSLEGQVAKYFTPESIFPIILAATSSGVWLLVILVVTYYLLVEWERIREWLIGLAPPRYHSDIRRLHAQVKLVWQAYLRGQLLMMLVVGASSAAGAAALGLQNALILGTIAGFLELIPSLGPAFATSLAAISAWTRGSVFFPLSGLWLTFLVIAVFTLIQLVQSVWIQPRILSRALHLHPALIFVAVVSSLVISGALVAIIIVPSIGSAIVVSRYLRRGRAALDPGSEEQPVRLAAGIGDEPVHCE